MMIKENKDWVLPEVNCQYSKENMIIFCKYCGSGNLEEKVVAYEENVVSERKVLCKECGSLINYWSYGYYDNDIDEEYEQMLLEKKLKRILKKNEF